MKIVLTPPGGGGDSGSAGGGAVAFACFTIRQSMLTGGAWAGSRADTQEELKCASGIGGTLQSERQRVRIPMPEAGAEGASGTDRAGGCARECSSGTNGMGSVRRGVIPGMHSERLLAVPENSIFIAYCSIRKCLLALAV